ncbi:hypothetical protein C0989_008862, partial [Termitomyces sp. Mn162]
MFANTITLIDKTCHKMQHKHEAKEQQCHAKDQDVKMLSPSSAHSGKCKANTKPMGKPKPKKVKVSPALATYMPRSDAVLSLLGQINTALKALKPSDEWP